jgi:hypothetical protein
MQESVLICMAETAQSIADVKVRFPLAEKTEKVLTKVTVLSRMDGKRFQIFSE